VIAVGEELLPVAVERDDRGARPKWQLRTAVFMAIVDRLQRRRTLLPIELEFHAEIVEARAIERVEHAAAAILHRPEKVALELAVGGPDADAFGLLVILGHPQPALVVNRHAVRVVHPP